MKYILRTLWLIGYIFVFMLAIICFFISIFIYPIVGAFYFVKTGDVENTPFTPEFLATKLDTTYKKLLKYM